MEASGYGAGAYIAFATLMFTFVTTTATVSWFLSSKMNSNKESYLRKIDEIKSLSDNALDRFRTEVQMRFDTAYRELGEAPAAIRAKVGEVELILERQFLRKDDYVRDQDRLLLAFRSFTEAIEKKLDSVESKLEKAILEKLANVHS